MTPSAAQPVIPNDALSGQLPPERYFEPETFRQESEQIFPATWHYACRAAALEQVGQFQTVTVGQTTLFVVRNSAGELSAFHNVCPHRGAELVTEPCGGKKAIVCPYHSWTFALDGTLLSVPKQKAYFGDLDLAKLSLYPAAVEQWRGFVFVRPTIEGPTLAEYLGEFAGYLDGYHESYEDLVDVATYTFDEPVNWKIVIENYVEDYHFGYVHTDSLGMFDIDGIKTTAMGDHISVLMPYRQTWQGDSSKYPVDLERPSVQGFMFPTTTFQTAINHVSMLRIVPMGPERTVVEFLILQTPRQAAEYPLDLEALEKATAKDMEEDFAICRSLQRNVHSPRYHINALAREHEDGVRFFQQTWRRHLSD